MDSIPGLGSQPAEGNGNPLQYSCLKKTPQTEEPVGLQSIGLKESDTTEQLSTHTINCKHFHSYCKPGTIIKVLYMLTQIYITTILQDKDYHFFHFTTGETETWRDSIITQSPTDNKSPNQDLNTGNLAARAFTLDFQALSGFYQMWVHN